MTYKEHLDYIRDLRSTYILGKGTLKKEKQEENRMLKNYVFDVGEVMAESREEAEAKLIDRGHDRYYSLTTEPVHEEIMKELQKALKHAQTNHEKHLQNDDAVLVAYREGYMDGLDEAVKIVMSDFFSDEH